MKKKREKKKEFSVEDDIKAQHVVNEIYEILEKYELTGICIWDVATKSLKDVESMAINGNCLQMNVEDWSEDQENDTIDA